MRSWPVPTVSGEASRRLGRAPEVAVFDSRSRSVVATRPDATGLSSGSARMYVCGITPYDATHIGHAATNVAFDLLGRAWRAAGHDVHYVQNVTDVDDPLLERAAATGEDWRELAAREVELFREDMTALRVIPPDEYVGAVEAIPLVVGMVERLRGAGAVYHVDGDLYFSVTADPAFGSVSGLGRPEMVKLFGEHGGDPDRTGKADPLDCLLWQAPRDGEPSWSTALGEGRPGWHIECAAIATHHLGHSFDVQGGGSDLVFPHHEMSASEAQVAFPDTPFARAYVHGGMVGYRGEKMSKSLGNLVLVSVLRHQGVDPRALRLALLAHRYRDDWEWTDDDDLAVAGRRLERWSAAVRRDAAGGETVGRAVRERLADDLDAPGALALLDEWADQAGTTSEPGSGSLVAAVVDASLGIPL